MSRDDEPAERNHDEQAGEVAEEPTVEGGAGQPGQPVGTQAPQAAGATRKSLVDLVQELDSKAWIKAITGTMAVAGIGLGVLVFLMGAFGGMELTSGGSTSMPDAQYKLQLVSTVFQIAPYLGLAIASVAGLLVGFQMDASVRKRRATAAAAGFLGLVALVLLAEIIASTQAPSVRGTSYSLDYGQALVNSVLLGVVAAIMSGGAAYFATDLDA